MSLDFLYSEKDSAHFFVQDDVHLSHVLTPLFASFQLPSQEAGTQNAFEILKMPIHQFVCRLYKGRFYQFTPPYPGDIEQRMKEHQTAIEKRMPIIMEYYQDKVDSVLLPFYDHLRQAAQKILGAQEALKLLQEMHDFYTTAWTIHFDVVMPRMDVILILEDLYKKVTGETDGKPIYELLVGVMNKSLETDRAFWQLAAEIKDIPAIGELILQGEADQIEDKLHTLPAAKPFIDKMQHLIQIYGNRTSYSHEFVYETWIENHKYAWELIRSYLQKDYDFDKELTQLVNRREAALAAFLERVPDSELRQQFLHIYEIALTCAGLDEDHHFYIDAMLPATYRPVLLTIGKTLVNANVIDEPADIFFLYYDQVCAALQSPTNQMDTVYENRELYAEYQNEAAVPHLGPMPEATGEEDVMADRLFGLPKFLKENTDVSIKGYAASSGQHTGTVKIVKNQDEFSKVKPEDVLVCKTTTPPWTVLFSVAGAIVTDAGGILSHAGTVAREYGIPAVLGTKVATQMLKDGDLVTVDGTEGTVLIAQKS